MLSRYFAQVRVKEFHLNLISKECDTELIIKVATFTHSMIYLHFTARQEKVIQSSKSDLSKYYELTWHE